MARRVWLTNVVALLAASVISGPALAYDWIVTAHVTMVETSYAPTNLTIFIDVPAGTCAVGTVLQWTPQNGSTIERIASYDANLAVMLTAQATGATVTIYGNNSGCQMVYIHKN